MDKRKIEKFLIKIFWIFVIGSIIGFIAETIVVIVEDGKLENRQGLIYGPFVQIYGIGAIAYYLTVPKIKETKKIFFVCMIMGGVLEYLLSYIQQILFGTISWDYSEYKINLNGRTSLLHCIYWGLAGIFFIKLIYPQIEKIDLISNKIIFKQLTSIVAIFMIFDIIISWSAADRQEERMKNIPAQDKIDVFLDKYYSDKIMNRVYSNKINKLKEI